MSDSGDNRLPRRDVQLESAETLYEVVSVCERLLESERQLEKKEKALEAELEQIRIEKQNLMTRRKDAETRRALIEVVQDLFTIKCVDKENLEIVVDNLQDVNNLQLVMRYIGKRQLSLCKTLRRYLVKKTHATGSVIVSSAVKTESIGFMSQEMLKEYLLMITELQRLVDVKNMIQGRLESSHCQSVKQNVAIPVLEVLTNDVVKEEPARDAMILGHDPLLEQQMYELAGKVSTDWHELATCLGVSDELVVSVRRDIHTTREQAWVMLTHYASTVKKENINDTVCSVLAEIRSKNIRKKRASVLPPSFYDEPRFLGRGKELEILQTCFWDRKSRPSRTCVVKSFVLQVISGAAGVGKTALAVKYARKFQDAYCDGIFYLSADSWPSLHVSLRQLPMMSKDSLNGSLHEDNYRFLNYITQHSQVLIIYDSVCDFDLLQQIIPIRTSNVHILVTTQVTSSRAIVNAAKSVIQLEPLPLEHAVSALWTWALPFLKSQSDLDNQGIRDVVSCLPVSCMPLNIVHTGTFMRNSEVSCRVLSEMLQSRVEEFKSLLVNMETLLDGFHLAHVTEQVKRYVSSPSQLQLAQFEDINSLDIAPHDKLLLHVVRHRLSDTSLSHIVFQLAIDNLAESEPDAFELLEYACLMGSENVPGNILEQVVFSEEEYQSLRFSKAIVALSSSSIVKVYEWNRKFYVSFHPMIQSVLIDGLILAGKAKLYSKLTNLCEHLMTYCSVSSTKTVDTNQLTGLVVHLYCVAGHILSNQCYTRSCQQIVTTACRMALEMGHGAIALDLCNGMLKLVESSCREPHLKNSHLWTALVLLGRSCQLNEDFSSAQAYYERALQWIEDTGEETHEELGGSAKVVLADEYQFVLDELARCYGAVQIYADPDGKSVGCKRARPDDDYATAEALHNMGHKYRQMGQLRESVEAYEQSLALRGSHLEEGDINVAQTMINLALSLYETGEVSRAKSLLERAIPTLKRFLPAKHPLILNALKIQATCCLGSGDILQGKKLSEETLSMVMSSYPSDHPRLAFALMDSAEANRKAGGNIDVTISFTKQAIEIYKLHAASYGYELAIAFHNMGFYQYTKELYVEASFSLEESLKVRQSIGKLDAGSAQTMVRLGDCYVQCGNMDTAVARYKESLEVMKRSEVCDKEIICDVVIAIGKCLLLTRRFEDAAKYYAEANEMLSVSAPQSDAAATVSLLMGGCYCNMGQLDKAEDSFTKAISIARQCLPSNHPFITEAESELHSLWQMKYGGYVDTTY